jgi:hypothetical protein
MKRTRHFLKIWERNFEVRTKSLLLKEIVPCQKPRKEEINKLGRRKEIHS